jgi:hypothetical protein
MPDDWQQNPGWAWLGPQRAAPKSLRAVNAEAESFAQLLSEVKDGEWIECSATGFSQRLFLDILHGTQ